MKIHNARAIVLSLALACAAGLMSAGPATAEPSAATGFYIPPNPLPTTGNGDVVRSESVALLSGLVPPGVATATRVMYQSADTHGAPVPTTGIVLSPTAQWGGPGPRPLVTYQVGTHGAGDMCAPSKLLTDTVLVDGAGVPMLEIQAMDMAWLLARGMAVVITDYQGLGTPSGHTYMQPLPEAHAALDAARAAIELGVVEPRAPIGIWGYSQGGGAAAAAAEQAQSYAPELNVRGSVVGAPPADPAAVMGYEDGKASSGVIGFFVNGLLAGYPQLAPAIDELLNDQGRDFLRRTADQCILGTVSTEAFRPTNGYTSSGQTIMDALESHPAIKSVLDSLVLGKTTPTAPVLLMQNTNDDVVPADQALAMVSAWRRGGADVTEANIDTPPLIPQAGIFGHTVGGLLAGPTAGNWLYDQLTR